jgi:putative ABC transport system permease protein
MVNPLTRLLSRLRTRFGRPVPDEEIDQEIRFHLAEEARLRTEAGMSAADAEASARRDFGNALRVREVTRAVWGQRVLDNLGQDLRFAWRTLHRSPGFTLVAVGTLALAIGATTALFTVVNSVVLRPLAFPEPHHLVMVFERSPEGNATNSVSERNYVDWRARIRSFDGLALMQQIPMNVVGSEEAEQVPGLLVSGEFFDVLGVPPLLGRTIRPGDDRVDGPPGVVLSHALWQRRHGASPSEIGAPILVNGSAHEVLGVMPPGFSLPGVRADLFVAMQLNTTAPRGGRSFTTVARLRAGLSLESAQAEMAGIAAQLARERPANLNWGANVVPLRDHAIGPVRRALWVLLAAVLCVLLIACANIASLLAMRATARAREMNVRLALGAGRWRLVHQLAVESLLLAGLGGGLGLLLAQAGVPAIVSLFPASFPLPRADEISVDGRVLAGTAAVSIGAGLFFGLLPGLQAGRGRVADVLRAGGRAVSGGTRARSVLVMAEVTLAVVLVVGAGLLVRSLAYLYAVDPGFRPQHVLTAPMLLLPSKYGDPVRRVAVLGQILERLRAIPGVTAAGSIHFLPLSGIESGTGVHRLDRPVPAPGEGQSASVSVVTPAYFRAMGIPLFAGRDFEERDGFQAPRVAVVNRAFVSRFFPGEDPLGKRVYVGWGFSLGRTVPPEFEIVGVVGDTRHGALHEPPRHTVFLSHAQEPGFMASLVVRTSGDPLAAAVAVRQQIRSVDPDQGVLSVRPMEGVLTDSIARPRVQAMLVGAFAVLALAMACLGLYGVLAYSVEQRRREIGVRVAVGATPGKILGLVVGQGLRLTATGLMIGLALALGVTRYLAAMLYGVQPTDPPVFLGVGLLLLAVAAAASWLPARQAMKVDPVVALREE